MAITPQMRTEVSQLYVALFGRAADGEGLGFWTQMRDSGKSMADIANIMFLTQPARVYYPTFLSNQEIIGAFYTNVLGRPADAEGLAFWTAKLNAPGASFGTVVAEMIAVVNAYTGTGEPSKSSHDLFVNRVNVAQYYGEHNGTVDGAKAVLAGVTKDAATVTSTKTAIDNGSVPGVNQGQTFTLTVNQDAGPAFTGTTGNDTFLAGAAQDGNGSLIDTLQDVDVLDGGSGLDTLEVTIASAPNISATIRNIETIRARFVDDGGLNLQNATGVSALIVNDTKSDAALNNIGAVNNLTFKNIRANVGLFGAAATAAELNLTFDDAVMDLNLGQTNGAKATTANITAIGSDVQIDSGQADQLTTANFTVTGKNSFSFTDSAASLTSLKVAGAGSLDVTFSPFTALKTLDASSQTGPLKADVSSNAAVTISTGSGADTINVTGQNAAGSKVSLGAGNDVLRVGNAAAKFDGGMDGGEGDDVLNITDAAGITAAIAAKFIGFEALDVSGGDQEFDLDVLKFAAVQIDEAIGGAPTGTITFNNAPDTFTITASSKTGSDSNAFDTDDITVNGKDYAGANESLTIAARINDGNKDGTVDGNLRMRVTADGVENVTIDAAVTALDGGTPVLKASNYTATVDLIDDAIKTLVIKGDARVALDNFGGFGALQSVDASASTGGVVMSVIDQGNSVQFIGSAGNDAYEGSAHGDTVYGSRGADTISLHADPASDVLVYKAATDSQLTDTDKNGKITVADAGYDTVLAFGVAEDKIDVTTFGFTLSQRGALDVSAKVVATTDLAAVADLFATVGLDRGVAFSTIGGHTYVFVDANKDGDFKAADDLVIKLNGIGAGITENTFQF